MKISSRVDGVDGLRGALSRIAEPFELTEHLEAAAEDVLAAAQANLTDGQPPESRSGALAESLTVDAASDGTGFIVGTPLDHGWHLEFGSSSRSASPWLKPAFDASRSGVLARVKFWLANSGKRATRG